MRKPNLKLDLKPIIEKKIIAAKTDQDKKVLAYALIKKGFSKNFDPEKMSTEENGTVYKYNGHFLFRETTLDKDKLHFKYELEEK